VGTPEQPPYSPGLAPSDSIYGNVTRRLKRKWLRQQSKDLYVVGFDALVKTWENGINFGEGYIKKYYFCQVGISHVLRFMSVCNLFTDSSPYFAPTLGF
jgi:hypothetical protein